MEAPKKPDYISGRLRAKMNETEERALVEMFDILHQHKLSYAQAQYIFDAMKEEVRYAWLEETIDQDKDLAKDS